MAGCLPPAGRQRALEAATHELVAAEHERSRRTYGAPRIHTQLSRAGERIAKKRVARLMAERGLSGLVPKRRGKTTIRVPGIATSPDLVRREWNPTEPNRLWVADITYVRTWEGWLYLPRSSTASVERASAGRSPTACGLSSSSTPFRWRSPAAEVELEGKWPWQGSPENRKVPGA